MTDPAKFLDDIETVIGKCVAVMPMHKGASPATARLA